MSSVLSKLLEAENLDNIFQPFSDEEKLERTKHQVDVVLDWGDLEKELLNAGLVWRKTENSNKAFFRGGPMHFSGDFRKYIVDLIKRYVDERADGMVTKLDKKNDVI
jgi:hypothetical protein